MKSSDAIVQSLIERQGNLDEPDGAFARRLGISRQGWQQVRTGKSGISTETLQRAATAFPDLAPEIMALFLPGKASILSSVGKTSGANGAAQ